MSTRKLILTAMACGLAILLAGGVFLFQTARNKVTVDPNRVGVAVKVSDVVATVVSFRRTSDQLQVVVHLDAAGRTTTLADIEQPWQLLIGQFLAKELPTGLSAGEQACRGLPLAARAATTCTLAFHNASGTPFLAIKLDGHEAQWRLDP